MPAKASNSNAARTSDAPPAPRERKLEQLIVELLDALDKQHFERKPPGEYRYSMRVTDAMLAARAALPKRALRKPRLRPEDEAKAT